MNHPFRHWSTSAVFRCGLACAAVLPLATAVHAQPVGGQNVEPSSAVAAVVKVPKPWYAPKSAVASRMKETVPLYESLPGLAFKAFSLAQADGQYGGLYLWRDLASARGFFNTAWFERVEKERGVKGQVVFYEVPLAIDNVVGGTARDLESSSVATVVSVAVPSGVGRARLIQEFQASIPVYQKVPGLLRKYYTLSDDGRFGGIYLWKDVASAQQWFTDAWSERVRKTYGSEARIEWFDTPILLPSKIAENKPAIPGL